MPLPQVWPEIVVTPRLLVRHVDLTLLRPKAEQMLPIEQGEKRLMFSAVEGFIRYFSPASHVVALRGQHCWALTMFVFRHVSDVQS